MTALHRATLLIWRTFMKIKRLFQATFLAIAAIVFNSMGAMSERTPPDPLISIAYRDAFDQHKIHPEFADLMFQWGCAANVFKDDGNLYELPLSKHPSDFELLPQPPFNGQSAFESSQEFALRNGGRAAEYAAACLAKLKNARIWTLGEPLRDNTVHAGLMVTAGVITALSLGTNTLAGGQGPLYAIFNCVGSANPCVRSCWHLAYPPSRELDELEVSFAKNQCFIPRVLWRKIITEFMLARTNPLTQDKHLNFLEFALDLTLYKQRAPLAVKEGYTFEAAMHELFARIEKFFEQNYVPLDQKGTQGIEALKSQIFDFLAEVANPKNAQSAFHYLYLRGSYGIGKTYFVNELCRWLNELFPGSIQHKILDNIESPAQLQGNNDHPGIILDVMRDQLKNGKNGSIIFIDEATWFNDEKMGGTCRTVFNGDQCKLSTSYLGEDITIENMPPMLIIVAANDPIKNPALSSRFIQVDFPAPKTEALAEYARKLAATSKYLGFTHTPVNTAAIDRWVRTAERSSVAPGSDRSAENASKQPEAQKSSTVSKSSQPEDPSKNQGITNFRDAKNGIDAFCRVQYLNHEKQQ